MVEWGRMTSQPRTHNLPVGTSGVSLRRDIAVRGQNHFVSIILPCLNEEKTVGRCIRQIKSRLAKTGLKGEIIVCDNASGDKSARIAREAGAKVVHEPIRGYGSAYLTGLKAASGDWIVIGDSDGTYNFQQITKLLAPLKSGYDLVVGSRMKGQISPGSMPFLNRYLGTPLLNLFLRIFYKIRLSDSQSGMRAFTQKALKKMRLKTLGMEFASEMLIRAAIENLKITEIPISYSKRIAPTKLSRFKDAWRHLRFMLLFTPTYLFLIPGAIFMAIGLAGLMVLARGPLLFLNHNFDFHSMILASMLLLLGYQVSMLGIYAKTFSWLEGLTKQDLIIHSALRYFKLEKGIILGLFISVLGFSIGFITFLNWAKQGFGPLWAIRPAILSMSLFILGIQIVFSSFFLSILGIGRKG